MAKVDIWMPLYIGDYIADTMRLSTEQHGAYLLMLMEEWMSGPLEDDDEELAAITKLPLDRWMKVREKLSKFYRIEGGFWTQGRLEQEKLAAEKRRETAKGNGKKGGRPPKNKNPEKTHGFNSGSEKETKEKPMGFNPVTENGDFQNPEKTSSPSPSPSPIKTPLTEVKNTHQPNYGVHTGGADH